jgi:hypothetical protein
VEYSITALDVPIKANRFERWQRSQGGETSCSLIRQTATDWSRKNNEIYVERLKEKQRDLRREAEAYRLAKELNGQQTGPSTSIKVGLALIGIIALVVAGQFAIA